MAVALLAVAAVTRSVLASEAEQRISELLSQESQEFASFVRQGRDPATGQPFVDARRLLRVFLDRQYAGRNEELLGIVPDGGVLRQHRELPAAPVYRDERSIQRIVRSPATSGRLERGTGEVRWAKVPISPTLDDSGVDAARNGAQSDAMFVVAYHADQTLDRPENVFRMLLVISAVALVLITGVGWVVAGRILAPVRLVRQTAAQLTEQDLTRRIPVRGRDDVAALAGTFNDMLDRLENAFAGQRRFIDDAGHELRTPITIVQGHLDVMGDSPGDRERTLRLVTGELGRMSRIVEELLLLAKSEQPDFVSLREVELAELTVDVYMKVRALDDRRWELAEVAEGPALLDPQRITQAMLQLAQNAVDHTPPDGVIRIGSRLVSTGVELYVADTGQGVDPADAELIFERFRRAGSARAAHGGAGLGLSIVRAIAEGHRGEVALHPTDGGGATFVLRLPYLVPEET